jgi:hypothetical protein
MYGTIYTIAKSDFNKFKSNFDGQTFWRETDKGIDIYLVGSKDLRELIESLEHTKRVESKECPNGETVAAADSKPAE